jgi:hypothetical protein
LYFCNIFITFASNYIEKAGESEWIAKSLGREAMSYIPIDPGQSRAEDLHSVLGRTLIAEYLLANGYLMSDIKKLPQGVERRLMKEAYRFAARRLAEIQSESNFQWFFRLPISKN